MKYIVRIFIKNIDAIDYVFKLLEPFIITFMVILQKDEPKINRTKVLPTQPHPTR